MLKDGERIVATRGAVDFVSMAVDAFTSGAARPAPAEAAPQGLPPIDENGD
jgi:hypothetical protein